MRTTNADRVDVLSLFEIYGDALAQAPPRHGKETGSSAPNARAAPAAEGTIPPSSEHGSPTDSARYSAVPCPPSAAEWSAEYVDRLTALITCPEARPSSASVTSPRARDRDPPMAGRPHPGCSRIPSPTRPHHLREARPRARGLRWCRVDQRAGGCCSDRRAAPLRAERDLRGAAHARPWHGGHRPGSGRAGLRGHQASWSARSGDLAARPDGSSTVGGILVFGRDRLHRFSDAWIRTGGLLPPSSTRRWGMSYSHTQ